MVIYIWIIRIGAQLKTAHIWFYLDSLFCLINKCQNARNSHLGALKKKIKLTQRYFFSSHTQSRVSFGNADVQLERLSHWINSPWDPEQATWSSRTGFLNTMGKYVSYSNLQDYYNNQRKVFYSGKIYDQDKILTNMARRKSRSTRVDIWTSLSNVLQTAG